MLIQLLSFKYDVCHKEFEPKSAGASWNATLSCLLSSCHTIPCSQLRMRIASFYELFKIMLALDTWTVMKTFAYTTGTTSKHQSQVTWIISKVDSIPVHCGATYECVLSFSLITWTSTYLLNTVHWWPDPGLHK